MNITISGIIYIILLLLNNFFVVGSLLVSFSLPRNYFKLTSDSTSNLELSRDLRSINAIRCICMFGVLMAHSALAMSILPADNPNYIESVMKAVFFFKMNFELWW